MMKKSALINSIIEVFDENTALKQKMAVMTHSEKSGVEDGESCRGRFVLMCYERGLKEITDSLYRRLTTEVETNSDGTYWTYEQWIEAVVGGYSNPFDNYDTKFLLRDFSINELLTELSPWFHEQYAKQLENRRLNDLKEKTKQKTE